MDLIETSGIVILMMDTRLLATCTLDMCTLKCEYSIFEYRSRNTTTCFVLCEQRICICGQTTCLPVEIQSWDHTSNSIYATMANCTFLLPMHSDWWYCDNTSRSKPGFISCITRNQKMNFHHTTKSFKDAGYSSWSWSSWLFPVVS